MLFAARFSKMSANEKVLLKDGLVQTESSIFSDRSNCFFRETKLIKNVEAKKQLRLNISVSSAKSLTPSFGNTLLYAVLLCGLFVNMGER